MKLFNLFKKNRQKEKSGKFSEFFLHASEEKKERVLKQVAHKANEEQMMIFTKSQIKTKTS